ncbi:MAG: T9SS type A sorting domain-containing protein [Bacteroidota bacterium]
MNLKGNTLLHIRLLLFILLGTGILHLPAQTFKTFYHSKAFLDAPVFTVNKLIRVPGTLEVAFAGELKTPAPAYSTYGYVLHADQNGEVVDMHAQKTNFPNGLNGIRTTGLTMDKLHRYYLAGASVQNLSQNSFAAERTLSSIQPDGKLNWSTMQGFYNFDAVAYDPVDNKLLTISGPGDILTPPDLVIQKFATNGSLFSGIRISTKTADQPVGLKVIPGGEGYIAIGIQDTATEKRPIVVKLDADLNILWSYAYQVNGVEWELKDLDILPNGPIGISGSVFSAKTNSWHPVLMTIHIDNGEPISYHEYSIQGAQEAKGYGLAAWFDPDEPGIRGWLLAGAWSEGSMSTTNRRAFAMKVKDNGKPVWTSSYSNFPVTEYDQDELAKDIIYFPISQQFSVVGEYSRYEHGDLDRRMIFLVKAGIDQGNIGTEPFMCYAPMTSYVSSNSITHTAIGTSVPVGPAQSFSYTMESLYPVWNYCAYIPGPKSHPKSTQSPSSFIEHIQQSTSLELLITLPRPSEGAEAEIFDLTGRVVRKLSIAPGTHTLAIPQNGLSSGVYLLRLRQGKDWSHSEKIWIR